MNPTIDQLRAQLEAWRGCALLLHRFVETCAPPERGTEARRIWDEAVNRFDELCFDGTNA